MFFPVFPDLLYLRNDIFIVSSYSLSIFLLLSSYFLYVRKYYSCALSITPIFLDKLIHFTCVINFTLLDIVSKFFPALSIIHFFLNYSRT